MKLRQLLQFKSFRLTGRWLDSAIEWLLMGLLLFMPAALGVVEPWSEMVAFGVAALLSVCLALKCWMPGGSRFVWTWNYVPLGLFALLAAFQLAPLSTGLARRISPQTVATKEALLADVPEVSLARTTVSFYPYATRHDLRMLLLAAGVFVVVVNVYRHRRQVERLLLAIALIGFGFVVLALAQDISEATEIYWVVDLSGGLANSGSFVNHSHYAQFVNLSLGAALALLLIRLEELRRRQSGSRGMARKILASPLIMGLTVMMILGGLTIFFSLSRNGVISLVVAAVFTGLGLALKSKLKLRAWIMLVLPLVLLAALLFAGFDAVYERMATLQRIKDDGRWQMMLATLDAWRHYPIWGTGLGTHEVVFPRFESAIEVTLAAHADCDYAQLLEETGVVGAGLMGAFLLGFWWRYTQLVRKRNRSVAMAAFGLGFGLLAVMIHSASDFGQHLPANFCLTAIFCGLLVSIGRIERRYDAGARSTDFSRKGPVEDRLRPGLQRRWLAGSMALCGLAALWGWVLWEANAARLGAEHWKRAGMAASRASQWNWQVGDDDYKDLIASAAAAADCEPDKVKPRYWLNYFRWHAISRVVDAKTGRVVWQPQSVRFAQRIAEELSQARVICPTFGPLYSFEGQLRLLFLGEAGGSELIRKGYELTPNDAATCFTAGILALREGQFDEAATRFKRAIALGGSAYSKDSFFSEIVHIYVDELGRPELVRGLVVDQLPEGVAAGEAPAGELSSRDQLFRDRFFKTRCRQWMTIIEILAATEEYACLAAEIRHETAVMLRRRCKAEDVTVDELAALADICRDSGQYAEAVDYYGRALGFNFDQLEWRVALAQCLANLGDVEEADHQARVCLWLSPGMGPAMQLIKELSVRGKGDDSVE